MTHHLEPLRCGVEPARAKALCVFVHGRTQSPEDMLSGILDHLTVRDIAFVLPRARGNSWYDARAVDPLTEPTHAALARSLAYLDGLVRAARDDVGPDVPLLIGGFSQGACLTLEYALHFGPWNGAMANLTGCRVGIPADERPRADLAGMPVYLTGSDADPWIPVDAFASAAGELGHARATLRAALFPGRSHSASPVEISTLNGMLEDLVAGRTPFADR